MSILDRERIKLFALQKKIGPALKEVDRLDTVKASSVCVRMVEEHAESAG